MTIITIAAGENRYQPAAGLGSKAALAIPNRATLNPTSTFVGGPAHQMKVSSALLIADSVVAIAKQQLHAAAALLVADSLFAKFPLFMKAGLKIDTAYHNHFRMTSPWFGVACTPDDSVTRLGRRAVWNVGGVDVANVKVTNFGNYFQLHMPGQAYSEEFYMSSPEEFYPLTGGSYLNATYMTPSDAWKRLVTIEPTTLAPYRIAVGPSLRAVQSVSERTTIPGHVDYDVFCGSNFFPHDAGGVFMSPSTVLGVTQLPPPVLPTWPAFLTPDTSRYRIFDRYCVYDPDDLPTGGTQGTMFMGYGWMDWPPFTAEVDVSMPGRRCPAELTTYDFMLPARYLVPQDNAPLVYVCSAVEAARKLVDKTLLQPKPTPVFTAGKPFLVGTDHYVVGQAVLAT